jgi:ribosome-associated protein
METQEKLKTVVTLLEEMKVDDLTTIDAGGKTIVADYFVLATATSDTHAKAITNHLNVRMKDLSNPPSHVENDAKWEWTIIDLDDVVVHVFQERTRTFYNLEELWGVVRKVRQKEPVKKRAR